MSKLSIVIPSRNEQYLTKTVGGIFANARGDLDVWVIIDGGQWPAGWAQTVERFKPRLHTIRFGESRGMRAGINAAVAASQGKYILKCDAHVLFAPAFDAILTEACGDREVIVPRRRRLDCENWRVITDDGKPPVDYEYLGWPELKGKVWNERAKERANVQVDETPLSQGSCWVMKRSYFEFLDLMDEENFGTFWKEMLEISVKAYLSGGRIRVHKGTEYAHPHMGRNYKLESSEQVKANQHSRRWVDDAAGWAKQTLPFKSFIERFSMPTWPNV